MSSPSVVWRGAPAEIEFGAFLPQNMTSGGNNFNYFPENQLMNLSAVLLFTAAFAVLPSF